MGIGIRITRDNIHQLADEEGVSVAVIYNEMVDAKLSFRREQEKRWAYGFFGKDGEWHDETMQKIREIRDNLSKDMNPIEATIKK